MPRSTSKPEDLLTPRQLEVLELLTHGLTNSEIADALGISTSTAKLHVSAVIKALDVTNRTEAVGLLRASEIPSIMSGSHSTRRTVSINLWRAPHDVNARRSRLQQDPVAGASSTFVFVSSADLRAFSACTTCAA